jgi:hypothetical protein
VQQNDWNRSKVSDEWLQAGRIRIEKVDVIVTETSMELKGFRHIPLSIAGRNEFACTDDQSVVHAFCLDSEISIDTVRKVMTAEAAQAILGDFDIPTDADI